MPAITDFSQYMTRGGLGNQVFNMNALPGYAGYQTARNSADPMATFSQSIDPAAADIYYEYLMKQNAGPYNNDFTQEDATNNIRLGMQQLGWSDGNTLDAFGGTQGVDEAPLKYGNWDTSAYPDLKSSGYIGHQSGPQNPGYYDAYRASVSDPGMSGMIPGLILALGAAGIGAGALGIGSTTPLTGAASEIAGSAGAGSLVGGAGADALGGAGTGALSQGAPFADSFLSGTAEDAGLASGNAANFAAASGAVPGAAGAVGGMPPGMQQLIQQLQQAGASPQQIQQVVQQLGGSALGGGQAGAGTGATSGTGTSGGMGNLLGLLGIGSGLNTMFNPPSPAVDPARVNALWQAGQNTYNTSLDPQQALFNQQQQLVRDQSNVTNSQYGLGQSPAGAGVANQNLTNFDLNWQNQQLQRQVAGTGAFAQAGQVGANAGLANNAQAFMQNQVGLNNLTGGLGTMFGGGGTGAAGATGGGNQLGSWLNNLFSGGQTTGGGTAATNPGSGYNPFPMSDPSATQGSFSTGMGP